MGYTGGDRVWEEASGRERPEGEPVKAFQELTYLGQMRRLRRLACGALAVYGLADARLEFLRRAGNTLYRVVAPGAGAAGTADDTYVPGRYLLRVHQPGYQTAEELASEMAWLAAMCREARLPVPEPLPTPDGQLLTQVSVPGMPEGRHCTLLRWVKGRLLTGTARPDHYRAQGRLMGGLHAFAAEWDPPAGFTKGCYDWGTLFGDDVIGRLTAAEVWSLLPPRYAEPFQAVAERVWHVMEAWGQGPDVYGLIHADLGVDANVLFWRGEARPIDFDDSGFGYWMYDLALSLEHCREEAEYPRYRDALLGGYAEIRSLPEAQLEQLDLFMAAVYAYLGLWSAAVAHLNPDASKPLLARLERCGRLAARYVAQL
jgi:Ser/Thr protein kinase RdoA (MazF antagonist)